MKYAELDLARAIDACIMALEAFAPEEVLDEIKDLHPIVAEISDRGVHNSI